MKCSKLVIIISCFLNVPFTLGHVKPPDSSSVGLQQKCYDTFAMRVGDITTEVRNNTKTCVDSADLKLQINRKVKTMQDLNTECASKTELAEYFACTTRTKHDSEELLSQILQLTENLDKIQQNRTACLIEAIEKGKYRSTSAQYDLNLCLQDVHRLNHQVTTLPPPPQSEFSSNNASEISEFIGELLEIYADLGNCIRGAEFKTCWDKMLLYQRMKEDINAVTNHSFNLGIFEKLTVIDNSENSCLRQFFVMYRMEDKSPYNFDLKKCLTNGFSSMMQLEENEDKDFELINKVKKLHDEFEPCRVITKDLDTLGCVFQLIYNNSLLNEIQGEITIKSNQNLEKLYEMIKLLYTKHWPCMDNLIRLTQFIGFNFNNYDIDQLLYCLVKGSKSPPILEITKDLVLDDLKNIQNVIRNCTLHPDTPGFQKCFLNTVRVYTGNIFRITTQLENYEELADESDKINHTCFASILESAADLDKDLTQVEKCIQRSKPDESINN